MKNKELKVTKKMLYDSLYRNNRVYSVKNGYCNLHDCCDICNPKVRFLCKIIRNIEGLQEKIIKRLIVE